jgi:hypothetical protein
LLVYLLVTFISSLPFMRSRCYEGLALAFPSTTVTSEMIFTVANSQIDNAMWAIVPLLVIAQSASIFLAIFTVATVIPIAEHILIDDDERLAIIATILATHVVLDTIMSTSWGRRYIPRSQQTSERLARACTESTAQAGGYAAILDEITQRAYDGIIDTPRRTFKGATKAFGKIRLYYEHQAQQRATENVWKAALKKAGKSEPRQKSILPTRLCRYLLLVLTMTVSTTAIAMQNIIVSYGSSTLETTLGMNNDASCQQYDSDLFVLAVDNCSTRSITNELSDYVSPPRPINITVKGIAGSCVATYVGKVLWKIEDDAGVTHEGLIHNVYYNKQSPYRLLSPQHWSQEHREGRGSKCITYHDAVELFWDQCKHIRSIPLDGRSNIALIRTKSAYHKFHSFCNEIATADDVLDEAELLTAPVATDDEGSVNTENTGPSTDDDDDSIDKLGDLHKRLHPDVPDDAFVLPSNASALTPEEKELEYE